MKLVIAGDSHVVALGRGRDEIPGPLLDFDGEIAIAKLARSPVLVRSFFEEENDRLVFRDPVIRESVTGVLGRPWIERADGDTVFAFSMGFTSTLLVRGLIRNRTLPWGVDYASEADDVHVMSAAVTREMIANYVRPIMDFYDAAQRLGLRFFVIESPPPHYRDPARRAGLGRRLHLRLDRLYRAQVREALAARGIAIVGPPPEVMAEGWKSGALLSSYQTDRRGDHHHANAAYGRVMLGAVLEMAKTRFA